MEPVIKIENLNKVYHLYDKPIDRMKEALSITNKIYHKDHYALKNISLEIYKGETVGILGTNGAGKSTMLKIISGVLNPTTGTVIVNGKISALLELGAGFNFEYTGMENIYLNGTMMGYTEEQMKDKVKSIIDFADIGNFINQPVKTYSSGMFARLAFAVAINVEPEILIVDETLSVGDLRFQIKCMNKMKQMMEGGTTVLFVSHDINAIRRFCTKAIYLRDGQIQEIGDVNVVADHYLDYLKIGDDAINIPTNEVELKEDIQEKLKEFIPRDGIAEIISFRILNRNRQEVCEIELDEQIQIEVYYDVYDDSIQHPVIGIAIRGMDDDYVCGLNSLLDSFIIPWKKGRQKIVLDYPYGVLAVGGKYYFDVALFEETATIPIQYITMVKRFTIKARYSGEGRYIIPHRWEKS